MSFSRRGSSTGTLTVAPHQGKLVREGIPRGLKYVLGSPDVKRLLLDTFIAATLQALPERYGGLGSAGRSI